MFTYLNTLSTEECRDILQKCCGSQRWVEKMIENRPYRSTQQVTQLAKNIWDALNKVDYLEAFSHHPKIGADISALKTKFRTTHSLSKAEQSGVSSASDEVLQALAQGNIEYEIKFGYIFIVCATGKSAAQMLSLLQKRLPNSPDDELKIAANEQLKITLLRLEKLTT